VALKRWDVTVELMQKFGLRHFAEIGVKAGKHVAEILKRVPGATVLAVDPWAAWSLIDPNEAERQFDKRAAMFPGRVFKLKMTGVEAAKTIKDGSLDMVFVDDSHEYETTSANIEAWLPKVRKGGIIAGHDIRNGFPGVDDAVLNVLGAVGKIELEPDSVWWVRL
jgi:hypothetical protein